MDQFALETLVGNLPGLLSMWTALTLSWGIYTAFAYGKMLNLVNKYYGGRSSTGTCNFVSMVGANVLLAAYLLSETHLVNLAGDSIIVVNIFYNAYLTFVSISLAQWWAHRKSYSTAVYQPHAFTRRIP